MKVLLQKQPFWYCWEGVESCETVDEVVGSDDVLDILNAVSLMFETLLEVRPNGLHELAETCCFRQIHQLLEFLLLGLNGTFNVVVYFLLDVLLIAPDYFVGAKTFFRRQEQFALLGSELGGRFDFLQNVLGEFVGKEQTAQDGFVVAVHLLEGEVG